MERLAEYQIPQQDLEDFENPHRFAYRICNDFGFFLRAVWIDRGFFKVAPLSWLELDAADYLANGPRERELLAFRSFGKTHLISALCCFRYRRDPARQIIVVSKSESATKKTLFMVKDWLKSIWFLQDLAPRPGQRDAATYFDVGALADLDQNNRQQSMFALGIGGQFENNRAHTIIGDDIETKTNTKTLESRQELRRLWHEASNVLYPDRPHSEGGPVDPTEIIVIGTPKHEETIYLDLKEQGSECRAYPIACPSSTEKVICLAPAIQAKLDSGELKPGDPTCPHRFGPTEIAFRRSKGYTEFARESMLIADLAESNKNPLRLRDLIVFPVNREIAPIRIAWGTYNSKGSTAIPSDEIPSMGLGEDRLYAPIYIEEHQWEPYSGTKAGLDPAGRGTDRTGLAIVSHLTGTLYLKLLAGLPGGAEPEQLEGIAAMLREHDAGEVHLETNIDVMGTFEAALQVAIRRLAIKPGEDSRFPRGWSCKIVHNRAIGQKEVRIIDTLEPVITTHRLVCDPSTLIPAKPFVRENDFQYQLTRITKQPKCLPEDGKLDALTIAVRAWLRSLYSDPEQSAEAKAQERFEEALKKHYAFFKSQEQPSICQFPSSHQF